MFNLVWSSCLRRFWECERNGCILLQKLVEAFHGSVTVKRDLQSPTIRCLRKGKPKHGSQIIVNEELVHDHGQQWIADVVEGLVGAALQFCAIVDVRMLSTRIHEEGEGYERLAGLVLLFPAEKNRMVGKPSTYREGKHEPRISWFTLIAWRIWAIFDRTKHRFIEFLLGRKNKNS